ncbi:Uma2 family endonuclease [Synechococcus moorigangaii CMS01]|nr:Uma2 family endonuclease [Synechococcus moorigangaii CMS01]
MLTKQRADRVLLSNISWQQFENILRDLGGTRASRVAYCDGTLEIMTPLPEHELYKEAIGDAIKDCADELEIDYESLGSTTWRKPAAKAGLEPDNCFYFQNEPLIRGQLDYDLSKDPPPDLALEIELTSRSLERFPIYSRLGVPEIWSYEDGKITIYLLDRGKYRVSETSLALPQISVTKMMALIEENRPLGRRAIRRAIREWAKTL